MRVAVLAIGLAVAAGSAVANEPVATKDADKDKVVCKWEARTGSNVPRKICLTKEQREQLAAESRMLLRESMGNNGTAPVEKPVFSGP